MERSRDGGTTTESVGKALRLLGLFRAAQTPVRLAEASASAGLARSTTHRLLATLQALGFVRQDPRTRAYFAGDALLALARSLSRDAELREVARVEMESLVTRTGETANFVVLRGDKAHFVDAVESPHQLRTAGRAGSDNDAHSTAAGKVLLAALDDDELLRRYPRERLAKHGPRTIATRRVLLEELVRVRTEGIAFSLEEGAPGVNSVACGLAAAGRPPAAALSLAGPAERTPPDVLERFAGELRRSAARIAERLP